MTSISHEMGDFTPTRNNGDSLTPLVRIYFIIRRVKIFWEGHKNLSHLPLFIWYYLGVSNCKWKMGQIFVSLSEYLNFILRLYTVQSRFSDTFDLPQKLSLNCIMSLNRMILCSKLKNGLCKIVTKWQVVTKSRLHCTTQYITKFNLKRNCLM